MRQRWAWPAAVLVVTAVYGAIPLLGSHEFYLRGDSAAQFAPTWYHLGELIRSGHWPPVLDPNNFAGGNYAAEGLYGIYNPLNALLYVFMSLVPNLLVGITIAKIVILMALALGVYRLTREYGAARPAAAALAVALPFCGYTLYWDAGSWPSGLIAFAYTVWVWWAFRRCLHHRLALTPTVIIGALAITQGNPYGAVGVVVVGLGLLLEGLLTGNRNGMYRLAGAGAAVAAFLPLVYIPLAEVSALASRSKLPFIDNTGVMRPSLGDLLGLGAPTLLPNIAAIRGPMAVPVVYFCWFALPLLPWLSPEPLKRRWRELTGVAFITAVFALITVGPSQLWLFRWPVRLIEYTWVGLAIALALVLSEPLRTDRRRARTVASLALVLVSCWMTVAQHPELHRAGVLGAAVLLLLTGALLLGIHRGLTRWLPVLAIGGTGLVLLTQAMVFHENESSRPWHVPASVSTLQDRFANLHGRVVQFADLRPLQTPGHDAALRHAWNYFLPGSMYDVAGVDAVNTYTGMGFGPFEHRLCLHYEGFTKPCGYPNLWQPLIPNGPPLADLMKVDTVVVQRAFSGYTQPPAGWTKTIDDGERVVYARTTAEKWPHSRLSWTTPDVQVSDAHSIGKYGDQVTLSSTGTAQRVVFAELSWPGYAADLDGRSLKVERNTAGLAVVKLPAGASGTLTLSYHTPGQKAGLALGLLALLGAVAADVLLRRRRRG